jgi:hypothetical protein
MTEPAPSADRIFVSYRRDDAAYPAGWLVDRLAGRFGAAQVFKDIDSIELGDDFERDIMAAVGSCAVLLAVIGARWLTVTGKDGRRRIEDPGDYVRLEIESALARDVRVIPVLVDGARMPAAADLPPSLAGLARRQAVELSPGSFDTSRLLEVLDRTLSGTTPADAPDPPDSRPGMAYGRVGAHRIPADPDQNEITRTAVISISRGRDEWRDKFAAYRVLIDDAEVGKIRQGQQCEYRVAPASHRIQLKLTSGSSPVEAVTLNTGERARFICGANWSMINPYSVKSWKKEFTTPKDTYIKLERE